MTPSWWLTVVLAAIAVSLGGMAWTAYAALRRSREQVADLEARLGRATRSLEAAGLAISDERPRRTLRVARRAARAVIETAGLLRSGGMSQLLNASLEELNRWAAEDRTEVERWATPEGLVTVMFSDIEGSTATNEELGDEAWLKVLDAHDALVRREVERHDGHVVKTQGDGFMLAFGNPLGAVKAATGIQQRLADTRNRHLRHASVAVRIGIHTGQVVSHDGDYFGRNVALAARVASAAEGGQILVTDEVKAIVTGTAAVHPEFVQEEAVELKGLSGLYQLWSVRW